MLSKKQLGFVKKSGYVVELDSVEDVIMLKAPHNIFEDIVSGEPQILLTASYDDGLSIYCGDEQWPPIPVTKPVAAAYIYCLAEKMAKDKKTILHVKKSPEKAIKLTRKELSRFNTLCGLIELESVNKDDAIADAHANNVIWEYKILKGLLND